MDRRAVRNLQRRLKTINDRAGKLYTEKREIVAKLQGICDHPETSPYRWEHDNGYGRQSRMMGRSCVFCGWLDLWNNNDFVDPNDCFKD